VTLTHIDANTRDTNSDIDAVILTQWCRHSNTNTQWH